MCQRPCLYFVAGTCANGGACMFCHASHQRRRLHLDKQNRETLRSMPLPELWVTLEPILRTRVPAVDSSPEALRLVGSLCELCGSACERPANQRDLSNGFLAASGAALEEEEEQFESEPAASESAGRTSTAKRRFIVALREVSLRTLLSSLRRSALAGAPERSRALHELLEYLSGTMSHAQAHP